MADTTPATEAEDAPATAGTTANNGNETATTTKNETRNETRNNAANEDENDDDKTKPLHPNDGGDGTHTPERTHIDEELLKPLKIVNLIVDHPCKMCCCIVILMILLLVADSFVFALAEPSNRTWFVQDDETAIDYDSWTLAEEELSNHGGDEFVTDPQTEEAAMLTVYWMFELDSYNGDIGDEGTDYWILTPENVKLILEYEDKILDDNEFTDYYCYVTDTTTYDCEVTSIARMVAEEFDYDYDSMTTEEIKEYVLNQFWVSSATPGTISSSFNKKFEETNQTYLYRSFLKVGLPIAENVNRTYNSTGGVIKISKSSSYINDNDNYDEQVDTFNEWAIDYWEDITVDNNGDLKDGDLRVVYYVFTVFQDYFNLLLLASMAWVGAAIFCVLFWVTFHLQSIILSSMALFQIILSFPFAYFLYYYILQISHFDTLSLLIIFVLLGVGADDVFVFTDAWRQSLFFVKDPTSLRERMTFAYRRAVKAMLVTQATTTFAFLATAASRIMPISAFGIWAALIVACNYCLVITLYPIFVLLHHKFILPFETKYCCCCCHKEEEEEKAKEKKKETKSKEPELGREIELGKITAEQRDADVPPNLERLKSVEEQSVEYGCLEQFFALTWTKYVHKGRIPILVAFMTLFAIVIWRASLLEEQDEDESFFSSNHYMQRTEDLTNSFSAAQESGLVYVITLWGVKGVNRGDSDYWDPTDYGKIKWDNGFDLSTPEAQQYLFDTCQNLSYSELAFQPSSVYCPMTMFNEYLTNVTNESFPYVYMDPDDDDYDAEIQSKLFIEKFYNFSNDPTSLSLHIYSLMFIDDSDPDDLILRYVAIGTFSSNGWDESLTEGREFQDDWNEWLESTYTKNNDCPDGLQNAKSSAYRWCWMRTNREFILSAFQGIAIALPLAFVVLLLSTQNWIMAIFATIDIIGVMMCELGTMEMMGWQFGVSESVAIVIVIGFSVDYVVHLANAYLECPSGVRQERIQFALLTMGISVVSGAVTTLLAGICLVFPEVTFFFKMGILIVTTILFSLAWSMLFFIALLSQFGPQFETGHIPFEKLPVHKIKAMCKREQE